MSRESYSLKSISKDRIFVKFFMVILFHAQSLCQKSAEEMFIHISFLMFILGFFCHVKKPTHYLRNCSFTVKCAVYTAVNLLNLQTFELKMNK